MRLFLQEDILNCSYLGGGGETKLHYVTLSQHIDTLYMNSAVKFSQSFLYFLRLDFCVLQIHAEISATVCITVKEQGRNRENSIYLFLSNLINPPLDFIFH